MEKKVLEAAVRDTISKPGRSTLRQTGKVPGILYAKSISPVAFSVLENAIKPFVFTSEAHIINLKLDNQQEYDCVLKDVQFDPVTDRVIHFDLQVLVSGEKIEIEVPVTLKGTSIGVRDGGLLQQFYHKISIECVPANIPEHIELDITNLKLGDSIHAGDIHIEGIDILIGAENVLVAVTHPRAGGDEAQEGSAARTEPEVISKGKDKLTEE